jgi:hypothetical protein
MDYDDNDVMNKYVIWRKIWRRHIGTELHHW